MRGRSTSGFHRPGRHCSLRQARSAVRCFGESQERWAASYRKPTGCEADFGTFVHAFLHMGDSVEQKGGWLGEGNEHTAGSTSARGSLRFCCCAITHDTPGTPVYDKIDRNMVRRRRSQPRFGLNPRPPTTASLPVRAYVHQHSFSLLV